MGRNNSAAAVGEKARSFFGGMSAYLLYREIWTDGRYVLKEGTGRCPALKGRRKERFDKLVREYCARYRYIDNLVQSVNGRTGAAGSCIAFITITKPEAESLGRLQAMTHTIVHKKYVQRYFYVYEQRSKAAEDVHGTHVHILVHHENPHDSVRAMVKNLCPGWITDISAKKVSWIKDKLAYMLGEKSTVEKRLMVAKDAVWRGTQAIRKFYYGGRWPEFVGEFSSLRNWNDLLIEGCDHQPDLQRIFDWQHGEEYAAARAANEHEERDRERSDYETDSMESVVMYD